MEYRAPCVTIRFNALVFRSGPTCLARSVTYISFVVYLFISYFFQMWYYVKHIVHSIPYFAFLWNIWSSYCWLCSYQPTRILVCLEWNYKRICWFWRGIAVSSSISWNFFKFNLVLLRELFCYKSYSHWVALLKQL